MRILIHCMKFSTSHVFIFLPHILKLLHLDNKTRPRGILSPLPRTRDDFKPFETLRKYFVLEDK